MLNTVQVDFARHGSAPKCSSEISSAKKGAYATKTASRKHRGLASQLGWEVSNFAVPGYTNNSRKDTNSTLFNKLTESLMNGFRINAGSLDARRSGT